MKAVPALRRMLSGLRLFPRGHPLNGTAAQPAREPRIGLALGGGFARGIAHAGVLDVFEKHGIPIHVITGVSAGAIAAAAYASGATPAEIARAGCAMRFGDIGRWSICRMGFVVSERMKRFLEKLLKCSRFEQMRVPLGVLATDLASGEPVTFHGEGDVILPIRASCSYPGLFQPMRYEDRLLVDGAMSVEIPAVLARLLGATHVIAVHLPAMEPNAVPRNMFQVVNRCFQIMQSRNEESWRSASDLVITPDVRGISWDAFGSGPDLVKAGEAAALAALPIVRKWSGTGIPACVGLPAPAARSYLAEE
ncbi:MAG TPA: patatin-like phospholipase family protein, partial [Bryobacteraceae bacterium]